MDFYTMTEQAVKLYALLQDERSRDVFWARLAYDIHPSMSGMLRLWELSGIPGEQEIQRQRNWKADFQNLLDTGRQVYLYGAGLRGTQVAADILHDNGSFSGFVDRNYSSLPEMILEKPVYSPDVLFNNQYSAYVVITTAGYQEEIADFLKRKGFPAGQILSYFGKNGLGQNIPTNQQYFEFPELFPKGTAFMDCGCFDGADSLYFAEWCEGQYSKIFAFEPDMKNYQKCRRNLASLPNVKLVQAGLGEKSDRALFSSVGKGHSRLASLSGKTNVDDQLFHNADVEAVEVCALDDLAADDRIGFIKMDIEGAEMQALKGARATICRDKPFLAICVYHKPGDVLAIMDYLHGLVPEYRFWLRHYELYANETVLYASL